MSRSGETTEAGRELDALVAEKVMGLGPLTSGFGGPKTAYPADPSKPQHRLAPVPDYSTDIAAAWDVVEALDVRGWLLGLLRLHNPVRWSASFTHPDFDDVMADTATAEQSICRAALKAVMAAEEAPHAG